MRKRWLAALPLVVAALAFATTATGSGKTAASSSLFRLGTASGIDSLNPYVAFNQDSYSAFEYMYPVLVQYDSKLHFAPFFATSWSRSKNGKTWTFKTRAHAKWNDGKPLTAADAAWTINTDIKYKNGGAANEAGIINHISGASAPNATTLVVRYSEAPNPAYVLGQFQQFFILPKHIWAQHIGNKGAGLKTFPNNPTNAPVVSSGPFNLVKFQKNNIAIFERNNTYWGVKPKVQEFGLQQYSDDDAMVTALKAHALDAIEAVPATSMKTLRGSGFVVSDVPGLDETDFIINSNPKKKHHRELLNLKVKEAFDHAIDRKKIDSVVWLGAASEPSSIIPASAGAGWHNTHLKPPTFNLKLANKLLDEAGYKRGAGGIRVANGKKMSYQVVTPTDVQSIPRTFAIIQTDFRKIGVQLSQKTLDSTAAAAITTTPYQDYDLAMWDWTALIDPDFMLSVVTCAQWGGWSDSGFCNKHYDKLYSEQQLAPTVAKRRQIVWQMQAFLYKQRPYLWISNDDSVDAVAKNWVGFKNTAQGPFNELNIQSLTQVHQK
jgi:peptide/nickel transport system substrate-binding protein